MSESNLWYLVPLMFGLLGGIVAYIGLRDRDEGKAYLCLAVGFIVSLFQWFIVLAMI